jgi:hypothetical protein
MSTKWYFSPEKILAQPEEDGTLVAHVGDLSSLKLNQVAFDILQLLYEPQTLDSMVDQLCQVYDAGQEECARFVLLFLHELECNGWVVALPPGQNETPLNSRYLGLLKRALVNWIYPEHELQVSYLQSDHVAKDRLARSRYLRDISSIEAEKYAELLEKKKHGFVTVLSHTLVGLRRLNHLEYCARQIFAQGIPGDFFEAGVCQGGASIFLRALQVVFGEEQRKTWAADSFEGLPPAALPQDEGLDFTESNYPWLAFGQERVEDHFRRYDLWSDQVRLVKGWFSETLPTLDCGPLALLRLDADLYQSTMEVLVNLYDKVVPGGFVVVDDYGAFEACRLAIDDFRLERNIQEPLKWIDWSGVYWRKDC